MAALKPVVKVELLFGFVWVDITAYVRIDDSGIVQIVRGRQDEQSQPAAATCKLQLNNADGRFSPRNASGAYFGNIGRNTRMQVSLKDDHSVFQVRFSGEVAEWPVTWEESGNAVWVSVTAAGPRRRLQRGISFASPYRRLVDRSSDVVSYWPLEDPATATSFASGTLHGAPGTFTGSAVRLASDSSFPASGPLPVMGDFSEFDFPVANYTVAAAGQTIRWLQSATVASGTASLAVQVFTTGDYTFELDYAPTADSYKLSWISNSTGATIGTTGAITPWFGQGVDSIVNLSLKQNGTGIDYALVVIPPSGAAGPVTSGTIAASTLGKVTKLAFFNGTGMTTAIGHVEVINDQPATSLLYPVLSGYAGETAYDRAVRLANEEGVSALMVNAVTGSSTELMGAQGSGSFLDLFDESATTEDGLSTEDLDDFQLAWYARTQLYRPNSEAVVVAYTDLNGIQPTDDDQGLVNDLTVTRNGGASARAVAIDGLTVAEVGTYAAAVSLSLYSDTQARPQAEWRVGVASADYPRWPVIALDAARASLDIRDELFLVRETDTLRVDGLPSFSGGDTSQQRAAILGWTETISYTEWQFSFNCAPAEPWQVFILDSFSAGILDQNRLGM
jgi:hypothetical protein